MPCTHQLSLARNRHKYAASLITQRYIRVHIRMQAAHRNRYYNQRIELGTVKFVDSRLVTGVHRLRVTSKIAFGGYEIRNSRTNDGGTQKGRKSEGYTWGTGEEGREKPDFLQPCNVFPTFLLLYPPHPSPLPRRVRGRASHYPTTMYDGTSQVEGLGSHRARFRVRSYVYI